jgi:TrmH family RNA methyltransferase
MITSPQNEKLKLVRKLRERKHRDQAQAFLTEGEDLLEAGLLAGAKPRFVLVAAGAELPPAGQAKTGAAQVSGEEIEQQLLDEVSFLSSGTRTIAVWPQRWARTTGSFSLYLHGVGDPGNVGAIVRTAHALIGGTVVLGPHCADPYSPKAVRASMGAIFAQPLLRAELDATPRPRVALVAHGGKALVGADGEEGAGVLAAAATICLGAERDGLPAEALLQCDSRLTIPLRSGVAESLNVAAVAAIVCERVASAAYIDDSSRASEREP